MLLKKKKLLNVKYKRKADSARLLDKQFSITDRSHFKINIKGSNYYFHRTEEKNVYKVHAEDTNVSNTINIGGSVQLEHKDGTSIYFDLYEDFIYALDYGLTAYAVLSIVLNLLFASLIPDMSEANKVKKVSEQKEVDLKRVNNLLKKLEKKKVAVKKVTPPKPKPKKVEPPKPKPKKRVAKRTPLKKKRVVKKRSVALQKNPRPAKKQGRTKVVNDKRKMKRLVVQKGPVRKGGTGPRNPNAKGNSARRSQAKKLAMAKAKVASSLNFLSKGKNSSFSIPPGAAGGRGFNRGGGKGLAGAKNVSGKNFLAKVTGKNVIGSSSGAINTSGSRTIATGPVVSDGEINGIANGKSLNYVQGKVSVSGLHSAGGSGNFSGGAQSMSVKGKISESLIRKIIAKNMGKITYCYEKSLLSSPDLSGIVSVSWSIRPGGRVTSARVVKSQLNNGKLHSCLTGVIKKISFAPGPKGGSATVTYPFNFTSSML